MAGQVLVVDENVPFAHEAFGTQGDVRLKHGREIGRPDLAEADLLIVRAITRVDADLLDGPHGQPHVGVIGAGLGAVEVGAASLRMMSAARPVSPRSTVPPL